MLVEKVETRFLRLGGGQYLMLHWPSAADHAGARLALVLSDGGGNSYRLELKPDELRSLLMGLGAIEDYCRGNKRATPPSWSLLSRLAGLELQITYANRGDPYRVGIQCDLNKIAEHEALVSLEILEGMEGDLAETIRAFNDAAKDLLVQGSPQHSSRSPTP